MAASSSMTCLCCFHVYSMLDWNIVFIVLSAWSRMLSASTDTRLRLVTRVLQTGTGSGCLHVSMSWCDLSVLATWLPLKGGSTLFSHNIFLSFCLLLSVSSFFSSNHSFSSGRRLEREKGFGDGWENERKGCRDSERKKSTDAVNILFFARSCGKLRCCRKLCCDADGTVCNSLQGKALCNCPMSNTVSNGTECTTSL